MPSSSSSALFTTDSPVLQRVAARWRNVCDILQLPAFQEYVGLCREAWSDAWRASHSVGRLAAVTARPLVNLLLIASWWIFYILKTYVLRGFLLSAQKGLGQLRVAAAFLWRWQVTRSRRTCLLELAALAFVVLCILLRRYIAKRRYVQRVTAFVKRQKRKVVQAYAKTVRRVEQTSLWLAMCLPHALFVAAAVACRMTVPRIMSYLANDTYLYSLLSVWYPLLCTISSLQAYRNPLTATNDDSNNDDNTSMSRAKKNENTDEKTPSRRASKSKKSTAEKKGRKKSTTRRRSQPSDDTLQTPPPRRRRRSLSFFPRTTPGSKSLQRWMRRATPQRNTPDHIYEWKVDAQEWLQYWMVYALFTATMKLFHTLPLVGRIVRKSNLLQQVLGQVQLGFVLWVYCVPYMLVHSSSALQEEERDARPLSWLMRRLSPLLTTMGDGVSRAVPESVWTSLLDKVRSILDVLVLVKMISKETQATWLHRLEHAHPILLPSMTLLMPGFVTQYGVLYVSSILPSYKTALALRKGNNDHDDDDDINNDEIVLWLEYWVLNVLAQGVLSYWAPLLWWIPFSTHLIFGLWCHMQFPSTIASWYPVLEHELQAFYLLEAPPQSRGDGNGVDVDRTVTLSMLRRVVQWLPSGVEENSNRGDDSNDGGGSGGEQQQHEEQEGERVDRVDNDDIPREADAGHLVAQFSDEEVDDNDDDDEDFVMMGRTGSKRQQAGNRVHAKDKRNGDSDSDYSSNNENEPDNSKMALRRSTRRRKQRRMD